jgi:hypothetical protein
MTKIVTKVNKKARKKSVENATGWSAVLFDLQREIGRLESLVPIVERKIERGEPWPGDSATPPPPPPGRAVCNG